MLKKSINLLFILIFFFILIGVMHLFSYITVRDLNTGDKPHKNEFYVVFFDKNNRDAIFNNILNNAIDNTQYNLDPQNEYGEKFIDDISYTYDVLEKKERFTKIKTVVKNDDYTLTSIYSVKNNQIVLEKSYLYSFDYIFLSALISFILTYILRYMFLRVYLRKNK